MTPAQRVLRGGAVAMALLALVPGYFAVTLGWAPSADFDVTGFLFILQNLPRFTAVLCTGGCAGAAIYFWVRSLRAE